ncbi:hypothetical protein ASE63_15085 [Bosea sp. Root381]|uniref:hypothetical protein n=1 Tax=Bosea sp. Root381 TaxID=1736524 RepID=UPI0006F7E422|nr:hypothetical protein [Bosea sp. Root381]KRE16541.1 hypothetical protein ASE63_15085 [Bosea sp. Root381]
MLNAGLIAIAVNAGLLTFVADGPPRFDIEKSCAGLTARNSGIARPQQACHDDESKAQTALAASWANYSAADRNRCVESASLVGAPSYVQVLTCLEMTKPK